MWLSLLDHVRVEDVVDNTWKLDPHDLIPSFREMTSSAASLILHEQELSQTPTRPSSRQALTALLS